MTKTRYQTKDAIDMLQNECKAQFRKGEEFMDKSPDRLIEDGDILGPARFSGSEKSKNWYIDAEGFYSRFRRGDTIDLRSCDGTTVLESRKIKEITCPDTGILRLEISKKREFNPKDLKKEFFVYPNRSNFLDYKLIRSLKGLPENDSGIDYSKRPSKVKLDLKKFGFLNSVQCDSLSEVAERGLHGAVQGPPGTGKTQLLSALVSAAIENNLRVGIAAYTHTAVDNALSRVSKEMQSTKIVRCGDKSRIDLQRYPTKSDNLSFSASLGSIDRDHQLIGATVHSWVMTASPPRVDLLIIDEAAQVPSFFSPLISRLSERIILLGDDKQLPPVLTARNLNVPSSIFDLARDQIGSNLPMLDIQYRMNNSIQQWSAQTCYHGRLSPHESNFNRDIVKDIGVDKGIVGDLPVQLKLHASFRSSKVSFGEAELISNLANVLISDYSIPSSEIAVICPHRAQAGAVCATLQQTLNSEVFSKITVDTVERLQGQEKEVIFFSLGTPLNPKRPDEFKQQLDFLSDVRRLNVAVTRAKSRFYCFASEAMKSLIETNASSGRDLFGFLNWCGNIEIEDESAA